MFNLIKEKEVPRNKDFGTKGCLKREKHFNQTIWATIRLRVETEAKNGGTGGGGGVQQVNK